MSEQFRADGEESTTILGSFPVGEFISKYFQRRPLFLRDALPEFQSPLSADELAGLACEPEVEARLIENTKAPLTSASHGLRPWLLREGPIAEEDFAELGEKDWTLLVQDVDKWVPEVAKLLAFLNFLPRYSIDDIMVSYAVKGGSVGPHTDEYDVFLLQVEGTREWQLAERPGNARYRDDTELKVLQDFEPTTSHLARPGDVLYLPPGVAHFGEAQDECLTFSFGLRAPSETALISAFADQLIETSPGDLVRPRLDEAPQHIAELDHKLIGEVEKRLSTALKALSKDPAWLGKMLTTEKAHLPSQRPEEQLSMATAQQRLKRGDRLVRNAALPVLFMNHCKQTFLFAGGIEHSLSEDEGGDSFAHLVTEADRIDQISMKGLSKKASEIILELCNYGALLWEESD